MYGTVEITVFKLVCTRELQILLYVIIPGISHFRLVCAWCGDRFFPDKAKLVIQWVARRERLFVYDWINQAKGQLIEKQAQLIQHTIIIVSICTSSDFCHAQRVTGVIEINPTPFFYRLPVFFLHIVYSSAPCLFVVFTSRLVLSFVRLSLSAFFCFDNRQRLLTSEKITQNNLFLSRLVHSVSNWA